MKLTWLKFWDDAISKLFIYLYNRYSLPVLLDLLSEVGFDDFFE